jgi:hypothetical protein
VHGRGLEVVLLAEAGETAELVDDLEGRLGLVDPLACDLPLLARVGFHEGSAD